MLGTTNDTLELARLFQFQLDARERDAILSGISFGCWMSDEKKAAIQKFDESLSVAIDDFIKEKFNRQSPSSSRRHKSEQIATIFAPINKAR